MNTAQQVIDDITALVDEQMAGGEPEVGYDYGDPTFPHCSRCGRSWHGLPADGCPGSDDEGPLWVRPVESLESQFLATRQAIMTRVIQAFDIPPEMVELFRNGDA